MEKVIAKNGEKVLVAGSYKCTEHADSWFSFNKNETFGLCPRCRNENKKENTWFSIINNTNNFNTNSYRTKRFNSFLSSLFSHF